MLPQGFSAVGVRTGLKRPKDYDLGLIFSTLPCQAAGLFTQNQVKAGTRSSPLSEARRGLVFTCRA